ncbi:hypothetical protein OPKNFCMD_1203 [Methylobacterium crusticola]|uniref:DUF4760 domain-containing protein n=2 Tax=Methylobacterium crusticola TaxID=1697972 RepID=A0ABQ4QTG7_9HYPH|nr:hypothetical protein OPKNFCMD_1203 [Methylobacterium crusticola]
MDPKGVPIWIEYAKLIISMSTPIVTGIVGYLVLQLGFGIEKNKQLNQELVKKRLAFYDAVAPDLNRLFCFYQVVGDWSDLDPAKIIEMTRRIDKNFYVYRFIFSDKIFETYIEFSRGYFEPYAGAGLPARLRLDVHYVKRQMGSKFDEAWLPNVARAPGDHGEQSALYRRLMTDLGRTITGPSTVSTTG